MIISLHTIADDGDEVWIDAYLDDRKIDVGWRIPAYIDKELGLIVYTDEINLFVNGNQITVKETPFLLELLKNRM